ncbi:hypothetical protein MNU53_11735 (plasmid) [Staphylococcus epidermidis]|uniref:hypothetical protein n=1 Tax=Staphylococcus epidermidis TaxID=1282 RepID=UPI0020B30110|nr:hypothetical protein [Staphylococcus epidermidis]UTF66695.1 hypothetical protein MNU53_11735 [Staphylococcus epidermidis]
MQQNPNSESLSDLKDSDIFWTDAMLSMLENMKKEQVTVEEGIAYLENIIQKSGSNYKN